ncbi:MAG: carboxypeptidase-like regulatory domain-containing protein [Bacteroidia bacterium]
MFKQTTALLIFLFAFVSISYSQNRGTVFGTVLDEKNKPAEQVSVSVFGLPGAAKTDIYGNYSITVPADTTVELVFSNIGYKTERISIRLKNGEKRQLNKTLVTDAVSLPIADVHNDNRDNATMQTLSPKVLEGLANPSGNFEALLKTTMAVVSNNELSSEYSVRGGSFDENLVYVNDIEIYRPFLVRSGEQEGLSFVNGSMVENVYFSAGGFEAKYGDKLSSVLDVKYRKPRKRFAGSASASLLGGELTLEGTDAKKKFTYIVGVRQKSSQYILKSLDTKGEYKPSATDFQAYLTYQLSPRTELAILGNYNRNQYKVVPVNRETEFGTVNEALRFTVYFEGQEIDNYKTGTGAVTLTHRVDSNFRMKFIASAFKTQESETFDILGQYFIDQLENDLGSSSFGDVAFNRGVGSFLQHARNELTATVYNFEHKGYYLSNNEKNYFQYGIKYQHENIDDKLNEWIYLDSAGFSIPNPFDSIIEINSVLKAKNKLQSDRFSGFVENTTEFGKLHSFKLNYGIRASYWTVNQDLVFSPRVSAIYMPPNRKRLLFKLATGIYYQPPFYREMRSLEGVLNKNLKAQSAFHLVLGSEYTFLGFGREFKFVTEAYYKKLNDNVPYEIDNLRLRYFANNNATGYAYGIDFRLNGEFVEGAESWISLGLLNTKEDIKGDYYYDYYNEAGEKIIPGYTFDQTPADSIYYNPGYIPRPTDQRLTFSMYFQDYLPKFPSFKVYLALILGTGLPFGPPGDERYKDIYRYPPYRRVDIGFAKVFIDEDVKKQYRLKLFNHVRALSLSLEVFNLLQVNNTVSYLWIEDVTGRTYAIPNYLTARQLNLRLNVKF